MPPQQIQALFCQHFNCPPAEYEIRMLRKSLYWHARVLAPLVRAIKPNFFAEDLKFIRHLATSTETRELAVDQFNFRDANRANANFWRTMLKIRVSGRKAGRIASALLTENRSSPCSAHPATLL